MSNFNYQQPMHNYQPPQPKSSLKPLWIVLGIIGGLGFITLAVCCVGGYFIFQAGSGFTDSLSAEVQALVEDEPEMRQHIGDIRSFKMNLIKSGEIEDPDTFVYDVEGSRGSGEVIVKSITNFDGYEELESAQLILSNGQTIHVYP